MGDAVAAGALRLEDEAGGAEFFHVMPDGDAADAEFGGECGTGDPVGIAGEELAEDQVFSGVHGAEGGRRKAEGGEAEGGEGERGRLEPGNENENENENEIGNENENGNEIGNEDGNEIGNEDENEDEDEDENGNGNDWRGEWS